jgi:hypothetical protein
VCHRSRAKVRSRSTTSSVAATQAVLPNAAKACTPKLPGDLDAEDAILDAALGVTPAQGASSRTAPPSR